MLNCFTNNEDEGEYFIYTNNNHLLDKEKPFVGHQIQNLTLTVTMKTLVVPTYHAKSCSCMMRERRRKPV